MIKSTFFLLISIFLTPVSPLMHGFVDPLLRIRHMIPPTIIPKEHTQNREIQVFEAKDTTPAITPCLLFFTGGNALITPEIYSNFLATLSSKQVAIHTIPFRFSSAEFTKLVDQLSAEYSDIIAVSHSSGSVPLIDMVANNPTIKKVVMMDPIDSRLDRSKKIRMKYLTDMMIIRAEKAYEGETLAFIPGFLELGVDKFRLSPDCNTKVLDAEDYGHCDLLNPIYSNLIHQYLRNICDGASNRSRDHLYKYMEWLTDEIIRFSKPVEGGSDPCDELPCDL